jgi:hypothetical protein
MMVVNLNIFNRTHNDNDNDNDNDNSIFTILYVYVTPSNRMRKYS